MNETFSCLTVATAVVNWMDSDFCRFQRRWHNSWFSLEKCCQHKFLFISKMDSLLAWVFFAIFTLSWHSARCRQVIEVQWKAWIIVTYSIKVPVSNAFRTVSNVGCFVALTFYLLCSKKLASQIQRPLLTSILNLYSSLVDMKYNNTTITDHVILLLRCRFNENSLPAIFRHGHHHVRQRYAS